MTTKELLKAVEAAASHNPDAEVRVGWSFSEAGVEFVELVVSPEGCKLVVEADLSTVQKQNEARHLAFQREMAELDAQEARA